MDEIKKIEQSVDKSPLESKKFWALLVGLLTIFMVFISTKHFGIDLILAQKGMDSIISLIAIYMLGQGSMDVIKVWKQNGNN
jgi:hypothetical protein